MEKNDPHYRPVPEAPTRQERLLDPTLDLRIGDLQRAASSVAMCQVLDSAAHRRRHDNTFFGSSLG